MNTQTKKLVILFADINDSTALYENLGDEPARQLVSACLTTMSQRVAAHNGTLIKTLGDEIMCSFPSADAALRAAKEMQLAITADNHYSKHPLRVRIGFHFGDVLCEEQDIYGDTVNVAARITGMTRAGQIMTTRAAVDAMPPELHSEVHQILRAEFKSMQGQLDIFQVPWGSDDMQRTRVGIPAYRREADAGAELILRYCGQFCRVNDRLKKVFLGRGGSCKIVVVNDFTSRQHAEVESRSGNFVLRDNSINGTYIRFDDGQIECIRNAEIILRGIGTISLGRSYAEAPTELIIFSVPSSPEFEV